MPSAREESQCRAGRISRAASGVSLEDNRNRIGEAIQAQESGTASWCAFRYIDTSEPLGRVYQKGMEVSLRWMGHRLQKIWRGAARRLNLKKTETVGRNPAFSLNQSFRLK